MTEETFQVSLPGDRSITAIRSSPDGHSPDGQESEYLFIYAPGAGSNVHDPFGGYLCKQLVAHGTTAVRFQFPYKEAGQRRPDPPRVLEETWRTVVEAVRLASGKLAIGGRSMGGRIASQVVAQGVEG